MDRGAGAGGGSPILFVLDKFEAKSYRYIQNFLKTQYLSQLFCSNKTEGRNVTPKGLSDGLQELVWIELC